MTDTAMSDLLPCPFCGGEAGKIVDATRILGTFNLIHRCPIIGPLKIEHATQEAVIAKWNTRAPSQAQIDAAVKAALIDAAEMLDKRHRGDLPAHIPSESGNWVRELTRKGDQP